MSEDNRTINQLALESIEIQDACNLSGVIHAWSRSISRLRALGIVSGTGELNRHPINVLFASKVESLTGGNFHDAYDKVQALI